MKKHSADDLLHRSEVQGKLGAIKGLAGISLIVFLLDRLADKIHNALVNGFLGYIFTAYSSELSAYENGYVMSHFKGGSRVSKIFRGIRAYLSRSFEGSFIIKKLRHSVCNLAYLPLRTYGSFFLSFGIYTLLVYFIKIILPVMGEADAEQLLTGICICIIAIPLNASRLTLAKAVKNGRITGAIFVEAFGYRNEAFENKSLSKNSSRRSGIAILLGLLSGMLTFVVKPLYIILFIAVFVLVALIMVTPEIGILISLFCLPFLSLFSYPTVLLAVLVVLTAFSYFIKLIRGKRIFKLELLDLFVLLFLLMLLFSGIVTVGGDASYKSALMSCLLMLGYFLTVNLIRTEKWLHRCVLAIIGSGAVTAFIGIVQYVLGLSANAWLDTDYFPDIEGRATSLFENPNYLAAYLTIVFPFALYQAMTCKVKKERLLSVAVCATIAVCNVLTWCRAAWLAMIICTFIFFLIASRKTMRAVFAAIFVAPFLPFVLPDNVVTRFMSIGDISDSSTLYRMYTWRGSLKMAKEYIWGGIGYGTDAFAQLYPVYAYAGIETSPHSHSLYLQILLSMGIGALLCFSLIVLFYIQKNLEYIKTPVSREGMLITAASLVAVLSLLIMGIFDYVWYNYRIFWIFWVVLAIGVTCVRIGQREIERSKLYSECNEYSADVDIELN